MHISIPVFSSLLSFFFSKSSERLASPVCPPSSALQVPAFHDRDAWRACWKLRGQSWRTEPEINKKRQQQLARCLATLPNIEEGIYPFKGMKLSRSDVEWLLTNHENGKGPIDWNDETQRGREGLDLRGADLREVDLSGLPLAKLRCGVTYQERRITTRHQRLMASAHLEEANLSHTNLQGATFRNARLEGSNLEFAHLEGIDFVSAHLEGAYLAQADLSGAYLRRAFLDSGTFLNNISLFTETAGFGSLVDVNWGGANLATIQWQQLKSVGEERRAKQEKIQGKTKDNTTRLLEYEDAVRANRQLATELQSQGLNEEATYFAYRAQVLQRKVFWFQMIQHRISHRQRRRMLIAWLASWSLFLLAGFGYKPERSFLAYFLVISIFAIAYYFLGYTLGPSLSPLGSFVFSMTSFHGRGFFPGNNIQLDNPLTVLAAFEALVGLVIEVTFIATLTQRFFNR